MCNSKTEHAALSPGPGKDNSKIEHVARWPGKSIVNSNAENAALSARPKIVK
jgi:hypothetical protein